MTKKVSTLLLKADYFLMEFAHKWSIRKNGQRQSPLIYQKVGRHTIRITIPNTQYPGAQVPFNKKNVGFVNISILMSSD